MGHRKAAPLVHKGWATMGNKSTYFSVVWRDANPATTNQGLKNDLCYEFKDLQTPTTLNRTWCKGGCNSANTTINWSSFATDRNGIKYYQPTSAIGTIPTSSQFGSNSKCFVPYH